MPLSDKKIRQRLFSCQTALAQFIPWSDPKLGLPSGAAGSILEKKWVYPIRLEGRPDFLGGAMAVWLTPDRCITILSPIRPTSWLGCRNVFFHNDLPRSSLLTEDDLLPIANAAILSLMVSPRSTQSAGLTAIRCWAYACYMSLSAGQLISETWLYRVVLFTTHGYLSLFSYSLGCWYVFYSIEFIIRNLYCTFVLWTISPLSGRVGQDILRKDVYERYLLSSNLVNLKA